MFYQWFLFDFCLYSVFMYIIYTYVGVNMKNKKLLKTMKINVNFLQVLNMSTHLKGPVMNERIENKKRFIFETNKVLVLNIYSNLLKSAIYLKFSCLLNTQVCVYLNTYSNLWNPIIMLQLVPHFLITGTLP